MSTKKPKDRLIFIFDGIDFRTHGRAFVSCQACASPVPSHIHVGDLVEIVHAKRTVDRQVAAVVRAARKLVQSRRDVDGSFWDRFAIMEMAIAKLDRKRGRGRRG